MGGGGGGGGGEAVGHPDSEIGGPGLKNLFPPFGPQFGLKIRGDPRPLGLSPGSATAVAPSWS